VGDEVARYAVVFGYIFGMHDVLAASFGLMMSLIKFRFRGRAGSNGDEVFGERRGVADRFSLRHLDAFEDFRFV
jgi:hypothetical protein